MQASLKFFYNTMFSIYCKAIRFMKKNGNLLDFTIRMNYLCGLII